MEIETILRVLAPRGYRVNEDTLLRHVRLTPYIEGKGPTFELVTWDTNRRAKTGQYEIGFALFSSESEDPIIHSEYCGVPPSQAIDSDEATRGALQWAVLKPGDTDDEYFEENGYTPAMLDFANTHGEVLSMFAMEEDADPWEDLREH